MTDGGTNQTVTATAEELRAAEAVYAPASLRLYDLEVHGVSNPLLWRCPTARLQEQSSAPRSWVPAFARMRRRVQ